jgi:hypothetical protein
MSAHVPSLPLEIDPLIAEAKQRARRRRLLVAAGLLLALGAAAGGVLAFGSGGASGEVPWLGTRPQLGAANPPLAPACRASQLHATLGLQGGGFGTLVGSLTVANRGSAPCALVGMPRLSLAGATSSWRLQRGPQQNEYDPLTPAPSSLRALAPGRWATTAIEWSNWCGRGSSSYTSNPGKLPRALVLFAPGGGKIAVENTMGRAGHGTPVAPRCMAPGGSVLRASRFAPIVPQAPPISARRLPLGAKIISPVPTARRGTWLSYTLVLTNRGAKPYLFGRRCPAYLEDLGFGLRPVAFTLNCHASGPIASHAAARFAMRIFVPPHLGLGRGDRDPLEWTLAPHSWTSGVVAGVNVHIRK